MQVSRAFHAATRRPGRVTRDRAQGGGRGQCPYRNPTLQLRQPLELGPQPLQAWKCPPTPVTSDLDLSRLTTVLHRLGQNSGRF